MWRVSTPRPVTLDGNKGLYFEIKLPAVGRAGSLRRRSRLGSTSLAATA